MNYQVSQGQLIEQQNIDFKQKPCLDLTISIFSKSARRATITSRKKKRNVTGMGQQEKSDMFWISCQRNYVV